MVDEATSVAVLDTAAGVWVNMEPSTQSADYMRRCRHAVTAVRTPLLLFIFTPFLWSFVLTIVYGHEGWHVRALPCGSTDFRFHAYGLKLACPLIPVRSSLSFLPSGRPV